MTHFLAGESDKNGRNTEFYKLRSSSPLFVLRARGVSYASANVVDFKIHTNSDMTQIERVEYIDYKIVSERRNAGTLSAPNFVDEEVVTVLREADCF